MPKEIRSLKSEAARPGTAQPGRNQTSAEFIPLGANAGKPDLERMRLRKRNEFRAPKSSRLAKHLTNVSAKWFEFPNSAFLRISSFGFRI